VLSLSTDHEPRIDQQQATAPTDQTRVAAERAFAEAEQLRAQGAAEYLQRAAEKYYESLALWRQLADRQREADTLHSLGEIHAALSEVEKALGYYRQVLPLRQALGDRHGEAHALLDIGMSSVTLGEKQGGLDLLNQALTLNRAIADRSGEIATLNAMGSAYLSVSEPQNALNAYNQALALSRASGDRRREGHVLANLAMFYGNLEPEQALDFYNQALPLLRAAGDRPAEANTLHNLAELYLSRGEHAKARQYCLQALPLHRALGQRGPEAHTLEHLGAISAALGQPEKALDYYNQALATLSGGRDQMAAHILRNIGSVYARRGRPAQALDYYAQALPRARAVGARGVEASILAEIARVERDRGNLIEARTHIEAALGIIESVRTQIASPTLRSAYLASWHDYYALYVDLLVRLDERQSSVGFDAMALEAGERARARSLVELLTEARIDIQRGITPELKQRETAIHNRLASIQTQLIRAHSQSSPTPSRIAALEDELKQVEREREQLETELRQTHPKYAGLRYPSPLGLTAIQTLLDERTTLLEYFLGREGAFLFAVSKRDYLVARLPSASTLDVRVKRLRDALAQPTRSAFSNYLIQARRLYQELIQPASKLLSNKQALIIVPDGVLHHLPFEVLIQTGGRGAEQTEARRLPYLVRDYVISYAPSATVLAGLSSSGEATTRSEKLLLAYADPEYGERAEEKVSQAGMSVRGVFGSLTPWKLKRLAWSRAEVTRIAELYPEPETTVLVGAQASEENVKTEDRLSRYRFIHFAVHGLLNEARPQFSGLVLSLPQTNANPKSEIRNPKSVEDGLLQVYEIFNLRLNAEMVVLSACETGLGKEVKGEGLIGLTRAFLYAGTPSVVVSLWKVDDRSTAELMVRFYRRLKDGTVGKADALRQAQLDLISEGKFPHPYFWAPFVLVGKP
jgi:CHAT domain-containing protein/Tfp pilus assembly protein PilF